MTSGCVLLMSGGLDSAICASYAVNKYDQVFPLFFNYGQNHLEGERAAAYEICKLYGLDLTILDIPFFSSGDLVDPDANYGEKHPGTTGIDKLYVPGRNTVFMTIASAWGIGKEAFSVVSGVSETSQHATYPDVTDIAVQALEEALRKASPMDQLGLNEEIKLDTPLQFMEKEDVILSPELRAQDELFDKALSLSWTCSVGGVKQCLECRDCKSRARAFELANLKDPAL